MKKLRTHIIGVFTGLTLSAFAFPLAAEEVSQPQSQSLVPSFLQGIGAVFKGVEELMVNELDAMQKDQTVEEAKNIAISDVEWLLKNYVFVNAIGVSSLPENYKNLASSIAADLVERLSWNINSELEGVMKNPERLVDDIVNASHENFRDVRFNFSSNVKEGDIINIFPRDYNPELFAKQIAYELENVILSDDWTAPSVEQEVDDISVVGDTSPSQLDKNRAYRAALPKCIERIIEQHADDPEKALKIVMDTAKVREVCRLFSI